MSASLILEVGEAEIRQLTLTFVSFTLKVPNINIYMKKEVFIMAHELNEFNIVTANTALLTNPITREAIELAINYQLDMYEFYDFADDDDTPEPSELSVFIVPFINDHLIMVRANDPASNIIMTESLNSWIQVVQDDLTGWVNLTTGEPVTLSLQ